VCAKAAIDIQVLGGDMELIDGFRKKRSWFEKQDMPHQREDDVTCSAE
jgi:hypothetical protein